MNELWSGFNINYLMPFWSKKKKPEDKPQNQRPTTVVIMQSESLGMTVIEESESEKIKELEIDEWIDII